MGVSTNFQSKRISALSYQEGATRAFQLMQKFLQEKNSCSSLVRVKGLSFLLHFSSSPDVESSPASYSLARKVLLVTNRKPLRLEDIGIHPLSAVLGSLPIQISDGQSLAGRFNASN